MQPRYPHLPGPADLAYSKCGKYLFTVGDNMMLRRFPVGSPEIQPESIELPYNGLGVSVVPAHARDSTKLIVCGDNGLAEIYDVESLEKSSVVHRTALPLRQVRVSHDGQWCLLTGDDRCVCINLLDITQTVDVPVSGSAAKHADFHPSNSSVVSVATLDGVVRVFDLSRNDKLAEIEMIVPTIQSFTDKRSTEAKWSPQGEALAIPTKTFEVAIVSSKNWLPSTRYSGHNNAITALEWSPNGRYLASCGLDNRLLVFDAQTGGAVNDLELVDGCAIAWHPHSNEISAMTAKGTMYVIPNVVPESALPPFGGDPFNPVSSSKGEKRQDEEKLFLSDDDELVVEEEQSSAKHHPEHQHFDHPRHKSKKFKFEPSTQVPFQSGSTPWLNQRRYLSMSPVGYVWAVRQSSSHHSVTVCFFDQSQRRETHFQDNELFDLASLSSDACLLANSETGTISVRFHSSFSDNWSAHINTATDGKVTCVALSAEVAVIFTSFGYMRTYTLYGCPLSVSRCPVNVISCAARENEVVYVFNDGAYRYCYEDVATQRVFQKSDRLDMPPKAQVSALFFSEDGEPYVMDSMETLVTLVNSKRTGQSRWVPVLGPPNGPETTQRKYWPIGVSEGKLLCVVLRGQQQYPPIPLPITDEIDLQAPGVSAADGKYLVARTLLQQMQARMEWANDQGLELEAADEEVLADHAIEVDKMLLRRFQTACQDQRINRALQILQLIQNQESLQAAAQVAAAFELQSLVDKIESAIE